MSHKTNKNSKPKTCWVLTEGIAGTENQCLAVAESLSAHMPLETTVKRTGLRQPWKMLSPYLPFECAFSFTGDTLKAPWPDILIASGRKSVAASLYIKRKSAGRTLTVQLQDPRISAHNFDLIAVPAHDRLRDDNVIVTDTAPNLTSPTKFKGALKNYKKILAPYKKNGRRAIAVLIGGNSKTHKMGPQTTERLCRNLLYLREQGHSLLITTSRRTGEDIKNAIRDKISGENVFIWTTEDQDKIPNPYLGMLAYADAVLVTEDSVSMVSDALQTGAPVYTYKLEGNSPKFDRFYKPLKAKKIVHNFEGQIDFNVQQNSSANSAAELIAQKICDIA